MGEAGVGAHGTLMIIAFLFMTELAEVIAWWCSCKVSILCMGLGLVLVVENGTRLFNVHRLLNGGAFIIGLIAMAIILAQEEFKEAMSPVQRHVIYGFSIIVVIFLQIFFRVAYPDDKYKWMHRWAGRIINLWAFFVAFTGYELANFGSNDGEDGGGEDFNNLVIIFVFWYFLKFAIWAYFFTLRRLGKAQEYKGVGAEGIQLPTQDTVQTPAS